MNTSKSYFSPFNRNSDNREGSGIGNGAYPPSPLRVRSFPGLIAGVLSAAAFVAAPSAASAQLQLTVLAFQTDRIELSISGTLSGTPPDSALDQLTIQGPNRWVVVNGVTFTASSQQPLSGATLSVGESLPIRSTSLGSRINLHFDGELVSGTTQGSGSSVTLITSSPAFDPSAIALTDLRLHWGINTGQSAQPFGTFQSNAVAPEPSAYAALLGLAALGCVALRRRVR